MADTTVGQNAIAAEAAKGVAKGIDAKVNPAGAENKNPVSAKDAPIIDPNAGKEKYVVDGKERYLSPEEAKAYVQKGLAFEPKMDQLGRLQNETKAFLDTLEKDPAKVIYNEKFGKPADVLKKILGSTQVSDEVKDALGQWYYNNVIVPGNMSPEQREAAEWKRKAEAHDEMVRKQEEDRLTQAEESRVNEALETIKSKISEAMTEAGVPLNSKIAPQLAKRVAQIMQLGYVSGKVISPKEAMAKAKAELGEYRRAYYDALDEDKLVEELGKENAEKVRKYYLKAVKDSENKKPSNLKPSPKRDERKTMTPDQFRDYLDDLKKGK